MNDKPTGEWTADDDGVLLPFHRFVGQYAKEIAAAHNAALSAEREAKDRLLTQVADMMEQLAAEREEWQLATEECHRIIHRKNEELAAEREKHKVALQALDMLAVALAGHHHQWTGDQRGLYEHAVEVLKGGEIHTQPMP